MEDDRASVDILLRHGTVLSMDEERRIFTDGSIAISNGISILNRNLNLKCFAIINFHHLQIF